MIWFVNATGKIEGLMMLKYTCPSREPLEQSLWEKSIIKLLTENGWTKDRDDANTLGFTQKDKEGNEWIRDYDKKKRSFIQFNGSQQINIIQEKRKKKGEDDE